MQISANTINLIFRLWIIISSFIFSLIIYGTSMPKEYQYIYILPLFYSFINLVFGHIYTNINHNFPYFLVISVFYIRNSLAPFFLLLGDFINLFPYNDTTNINKAIALMCYEASFIFVFLRIQQKNNVRLNKTIQYTKSSFRLNIILIILFFLDCIIFSYSSTVRSLYTSIFSTDNVQYITSSSLSTGSIDKILYVLFGFTFNITRLLLPISILVYFRKKVGDNFVIFSTAILLCFLQLFFIGEETLYILILEFVIIKTTIQIAPKQKNKIYLLGLISVSLIFATLFYVKANIITSDSSSFGFTAISIMLQAYFPGITNIAGIFNIQEFNISYLWNDLAYIIPFKSVFFGSLGDNLNAIYTLENDARFQILPFIAQSYFYLNFLSPILSCIAIKIAIHYYKKTVNCSIWSYSINLLITIYFSVAPVFYNISIIGLFYISCFIPLILVAKICNK